MPSFRAVLEATSEVLLDPSSATDALQAACAGLYAAASLHLPPLHEAASALPSGKALSPADAARCLLDPLRTGTLVRGVQAAVERIHAAEPRRAVHVLYAGCGPFAPLLLALAHRHAAAHLQITLVDVHPASIAGARRLFELAGVGNRLRAAHCADASTFTLDDAARADVLVVEILQQALQHEPQVAVVANLAAQCPASTRWVPACIRIDAWLGDPQASPECPLRYHLGTVMELGPRSVEAFGAASRRGSIHVPLGALQVPHDAPEGLLLTLATQIDNGAGRTLAGSDSGLTRPLFLFPLGTIARGERFDMSYRLGVDPGIEIRRACPASGAA